MQNSKPMKYIILVGDGMGDLPIAELGGKTPLAFAKTPAMDRIAGEGELCLVRTVPEGFPPGSDVANLSLLGYLPHECYSGPPPLGGARPCGCPAPRGNPFPLHPGSPGF